MRKSESPLIYYLFCAVDAQTNCSESKQLDSA